MTQHNNEGQTELPDPYDVLPSDEMREKYGLYIANRPKFTLNPLNIPENLRSLISLAEKWGISDDIMREDAIGAASREELEDLVRVVSQFSEDDFDEWLAGPESKGPTYSREYVSFTELRDAFEAAQWRLEHWDELHKSDR